MSSCQEKSKSAQDSTTQPLEVAFVCHVEMDEELGYPTGTVGVSVNGKEESLGDAQACADIAKEDYERYEMPKEAIAACGGWYAGAGDYFYASRDEKVVKVYQGWQSEEQEDTGFHYELVKTIVIP